MKKKILYRTAAIVFWLLVWQAASMIIGQELLLVSPLTAAKKLWELMGTAEFRLSVGSTLLHILEGFALSALCGILLAALSGRFRPVRELCAPLMHAIKAMPVASFVILALIFVRSQYLSVLISFLMVLPIMYTNILAGIDATDKKLLEMAKLFRIGRWRTVCGIYLESIYPYLISACTLSLGMCWKSGIAAEVIGIPKHTIGSALYDAKLFFDTPALFAWTLAIVLLSILLEKVMLLIVKLIGRRRAHGDKT